MRLPALLRNAAGIGLLVIDGALHVLFVGTSTAAGVAIVISGVLTLMHGASMSNRLTEWWFASAFDGAEPSHGNASICFDFDRPM
jgi:hypothetical protein